MSRPAGPLCPQTERRAEARGARLRLARLRRRISLADLAARVDATRVTLARLERGDLSSNIGLLARVLAVLGLDADLDQLARDDELGQRLQDIRLRRPRRPSTRKQADG